MAHFPLTVKFLRDPVHANWRDIIGWLWLFSSSVGRPISTNIVKLAPAILTHLIGRLQPIYYVVHDVIFIVGKGRLFGLKRLWIVWAVIFPGILEFIGYFISGLTSFHVTWRLLDRWHCWDCYGHIQIFHITRDTLLLYISHINVCYRCFLYSTTFVCDISGENSG